MLLRLTSDDIVIMSSYPCVSLYTYSHQLIREMILKVMGAQSLLLYS